MYERFWQLPIIFELKDHNDEIVLCKALLDLVVVDHENKAIRVFDIKTTGQSVHSFVSSYMKFGYFRQGSFYFRAAINFFKSMFPEYQVMNTGFIVAEKANLNPPMIYHMSTQDIMTGEYGGITSYGKQVKGYRTLINDLGWHNSTDKWDYPREVYVNEGVTVIDNFNTAPMLTDKQQKIELDAMIESISDPNQVDMFETIASTTKPPDDWKTNLDKRDEKEKELSEYSELSPAELRKLENKIPMLKFQQKFQTQQKMMHHSNFY